MIYSVQDAMTLNTLIDEQEQVQEEIDRLEIMLWALEDKYDVILLKSNEIMLTSLAENIACLEQALDTYKIAAKVLENKKETYEALRKLQGL